MKTVHEKNVVGQLVRLMEEASPFEVLRALRQVYPDVDWPGPPDLRIHIDLERLEMLARFHATHAEAASILRVSRSTLTRRLRELPYRQAWDRGRDLTQVALREKQIERALEGSDTMLIWLGKVLLGQSDNPDAGPRERQPGDPEPQTIDLDELERELPYLIAELEQLP